MNIRDWLVLIRDWMVLIRDWMVLIRDWLVLTSDWLVGLCSRIVLIPSEPAACWCSPPAGGAGKP